MFAFRAETGACFAFASQGEAERIADLKDWHLLGLYGFWMGLDPTDAPLLLRETASDDLGLDGIATQPTPIVMQGQRKAPEGIRGLRLEWLLRLLDRLTHNCVNEFSQLDQYGQDLGYKVQAALNRQFFGHCSCAEHQSLVKYAPARLCISGT